VPTSLFLCAHVEIQMSGGPAGASAAYAHLALSFERDGYVVVDDFLSPQQLAAVRRERGDAMHFATCFSFMIEKKASRRVCTGGGALLLLLRHASDAKRVRACVKPIARCARSATR
jgi:hypothetical protein